MPDLLLYIAGIPLQMVAFDRLQDRRRGEVVTAFDNTEIDGTDCPKAVYRGATVPMTMADAAVVRTAVGAGAVECAGAMMDVSPLTCNVTLGDAPRTRHRRTDFRVALSLTLREV